MSSSTWSVVVLTPSARRITLKVNKHTTLLQVLEDVCAKVNNAGGGAGGDRLDPAEWDLTHYNRVLDLSLPLGSSGVANNGSVEMVAATRVRRDEEVKVGLQVPSGKRLVHSFPSSCTLWGVVEQWRGEVGVAGAGQEEVCVYMRRELAGRAELEGTTLRSLGLTHGQAVVRLLFREEGVRGVQANVSARISVPMRREEEENQRGGVGGGGGGKVGGGGQQMQKDEPMEMDDHHHQPGTTSGGGGGQQQKEVVNKPTTVSSAAAAASGNKGGVASSAPAAAAGGGGVSSGGSGGGVAVVVNAEQHSKPGDLHVLGPRDSVLYHGEDVLVDSSSSSDDTDDFYRVTVDDVRKMYRDLKDQRERLESTPLQISSARELERDACVLRLLHDHPETIVRVRFPDRFVLQGVFRTADTVDTVSQWVRSFLSNTQMPFYLFTTPPRLVLRGESRLVEEGLVGMAIVYFGTAEEQQQQRALKTELYGKVSAPDAALKLGRDRVNKTRRGQQEQQKQNEGASTSAGASAAVAVEEEESPSRRPVQQQQQQPAHQQGGGGGGGVPKWFKLK